MGTGKLDGVTRQITKLLQRDTRGLTIQELSEHAQTSRITAALALARLEGAGLIDVRVLGNCKLHYWRKKR